MSILGEVGVTTVVTDRCVARVLRSSADIKTLTGRQWSPRWRDSPVASLQLASPRRLSQRGLLPPHSAGRVCGLGLCYYSKFQVSLVSGRLNSLGCFSMKAADPGSANYSAQNFIRSP